jgi:hypothetical protein
VTAARRRDPLQAMPGIGPSLAADLRELGMREPADLRGLDPGRLYRDLGEIRGARQDPCVLYVFRCAVYYASTAAADRDPELLKWWNWKDRETA